MKRNVKPGIKATGAKIGISKPKTRTFTQDQVSDLMRRRVERSHQSFFNRYGVKDLSELDNLVGKSRSYDPMKQRFDELTIKNNELVTQHSDLKKKYAYKVGNIDSNKIADIEAYFKGKGIDIDETTLAEELKTHPDWVSRVGTVEVIGSEVNVPGQPSDAERAGALLGVNLT